MSDDEEARKLLYSALYHYKEAKKILPNIPQQIDKDNPLARLSEIQSLERQLARSVDFILSASRISDDTVIHDGNREITIDELSASVLLLEAIANIHRPRWLVWPENLPPHQLEYELEHGISLLRKYLTYKPEDVQAHLLLAKALVRLDRDPDAWDELEKIIEHFPTNSEARTLLFRLIRGAHRWDDIAVADYPGHPREFFVFETKHSKDDSWWEPYGGRLL